MIKTWIIVLCSLIGLNSFASHIVGGEVTYKHLSGNDYQVNLVLFRDCYNGIVPFDNPATITVFNRNGAIVLSRQLTLLKDTLAPMTGNTTTCPLDTTYVCISKGFYSDTISLPPLVGGYTIAYQRCCRISSLQNLVNSGEIGATYWTHIPGSELVAANNSPLFAIDPPFYAYTNTLNVLDQSATDSDGDSLVYFFTNVCIGADVCCPLIGGNSAGGVGCSAGCPLTESPPPYTSATYASTYTASQPVRSSTPMTIHPASGMISLTPTTLGNYAIGLGIREYRNHTLIGTYYRDFHMKVVPCGADTVSTPTGLQESSATAFSLYPNPAAGTVTISLGRPMKGACYTLTDISGRVVLRKEMEASAETIDISGLKRGLYFLSLSSDGAYTGIHKKLFIE